jgi:26S proteasome regulatory subunit N6
MDVDPPAAPEKEQTALERAMSTADASAAAGDEASALAQYRAVVAADVGAGEDFDRAWTIKSRAIVAMGIAHGRAGDVNATSQLLKDIQPLFVDVAKAKTAKVVRALVDRIASLPGAGAQKCSERLCREAIAWCRREKRSYLRHRIQARLGSVLLQQRKYKESLSQLKQLTREIKKLDDKQLMVEISLTESRVHHQLKDLPKARAALTAARSNANSMYVPPKMQGEIDQQSGTLFAEDKDYKTAYSYFFESFEAFHNFRDRRADAALSAWLEARAVLCLKYMLLCKIMMDKQQEVQSILASKHMLDYSKEGHAGAKEVEAMQAVGKAYKEKSLKRLDAVCSKYSEQLGGDLMVARHLEALRETMLEQNLRRIIQPYSRVEIAHIAAQIDLPVQLVERKLSQMILDGKFEGILDQGRGHLIKFDPQTKDRVFDASLDVVKNMDGVVESLFERAKKLHA